MFRRGPPPHYREGSFLPEDLVVLGQALRSARCPRLDLEQEKQGHLHSLQTFNLQEHVGQEGGEGGAPRAPSMRRPPSTTARKLRSKHTETSGSLPAQCKVPPPGQR